MSETLSEVDNIAFAVLPQNEHTTEIVSAASALLFEMIELGGFGIDDSEDERRHHLNHVQNCDHLFAAVTDDGEVVGAAISQGLIVIDQAGNLYRSALLKKIDRLAVMPKYQGKAIASKLLTLAERTHAQDGAEATYLYPMSDDLYTYYEKRGYAYLPHPDVLDNELLGKSLAAPKSTGTVA